MPSRRSRLEHEGRLPQPGVPAGPRNIANVEPPRQSGATSGDMTLEGYVPKTPVVWAPEGSPNYIPPEDRVAASGGPDPATIAASLLAGKPVTQNNVLSNLLDAEVPRIGEKKQALSHLKRLSHRLDALGSTGPLPGLGPEESQIASEVLETGKKMGASPKELLAAAETGLQETGFKNLKPYDNSFNEDTAGWREELAPYYKNRLNVKQSAKNFFHETKTDPAVPGGGGETPGELAQTVQGSAYGGEETYGTHEDQAQQILKAYEERSKHPKLEHALDQAKHQAIQAGVSPKQVGDVVHADPQAKTVKVRADAKGMVNWADRLEGTQEGTAKQVSWAEHFGLGNGPWCANFISNGLTRRGFKSLPANPNYVGSYEEWANEGQHATNIGADLAKAKPGDLVAFSGQHIGLYVGNGEMISGNFGDEVARSPVSADSTPVSMIIRPHYAGGTVNIPVEATNSNWGASTSGGEFSGVTGSPTSTLASLGSSSPQHDQSDQNLQAILELLGEPVPSVDEPTGALKRRRGDLLSLAMGSRA